MRKSLGTLRKSPLALPASDPLVATISTFLSQDLEPDVHEQVSRLALLVQRLCTHQSEEHTSREASELILPSLEVLVEHIGKEVAGLKQIDSELATLDEGVLIRAIASSEAKDEAPAKRAYLLDGLDTLRSLEDRRSEHMGCLLEAASLLERLVSLGLRQQGQERLQANRITMALAEVGGLGLSNENDDLSS